MSATGTDGERAARYARPDASMWLLNNVIEHPLDEGYAEAAQIRGGRGTGRLPVTVRGRLALGVGLALPALVLTIGAVQVRASAPVAAQERQELIQRIGTSNAGVDQSQRDNQQLQAQIAQLRRQPGPVNDTKQLRQLGLVTGVTAAYGPGLAVVLDDAASAGTDGGTNPRTAAGFGDTGRVRDRDVQLVVNALWQSGAEGIAINGQRLTSLSAIRAAGDAILVNNSPLVLPYRVLAIGGGGLSAGFQQNADGGVYLSTLQQQYAIRFSVTVQNRVDLPAAARSSLLYAVPSGGGGATP